MRYKRKKIWVAVLMEIVGIAVLSVFIMGLQTELSVRSQKTNSTEKLQTVEQLVANSETDKVEITDVYDQLYISKADSVALLAQTEEGFAYTDEHMKELKDLLNVNNILILDHQGEVQASAMRSSIEFGRKRFNQLREVFEKGGSAVPFNVTTDNMRCRYYGTKIDDQRMVVIEQKPDALYENLEINTSLETILDNIRVGQEGYVFAVSPLDYTFLSHPDKEIQGTDALAAGINPETIYDGFHGFITVNGGELYCSVARINDSYVIAAVPRTEINASRNLTTVVVVLAFFVVVTLIIAYTYFLNKEMDQELEEKIYKPLGKLWYNSRTGEKIIPMAVLGLVAILLLSIYMQTLFSLSRQSVTNMHRAAEAKTALETTDAQVQALTEEYNVSYLEKARLAAYVLGRLERDQLDQDFMIDFQEALQTKYLWYFDKNGKTVATNNDFWGFELSQDPESQSYLFWDILNGKSKEVVQESRSDEISGEMIQYIGVAIQDENHKTQGFAQIGVLPKRLERTLANTDMASVLSGIQTGNHGFVFAVNKETLNFDYYPDEDINGGSAAAYGMTERQLKGGYNDFITIDGDKYYCASIENEKDYIYVAVPNDTLFRFLIPVGFATAAVSLLFLLCIVAYLTIHSGRMPTEEEIEKEKGEKKENRDMIDVVLADGRKVKTQSILSRWSNQSIEWDNRTAGQKLATICRVIITVLTFAFLVVILLADSLFDKESLMHYILGGDWQKSLNIFALTSCVIRVITIYVGTVLARKMLMWFSMSLSAKGETICRLLDNFVKFASVIGIVYFCLDNVGVDTATLVASAGILTLIVGMGANSLVSDILAGLFIVFEGEFQVGDIVTIGDFRGTVLEIGIRTTKVKEGAGNIKVFANRNVTNVLNMTKDYSIVACDVGIEYGESLEYVENVLAKELPLVAKRLPAIVEGPYYKGVSELGDSSVNIKLICTCAEADRFQLDRDMKREVKLIFDRNNINIPFPQVVLNQPTESHTSTYKDKKDAKEFVEEQKELSKDMPMSED